MKNILLISALITLITHAQELEIKKATLSNAGVTAIYEQKIKEYETKILNLIIEKRMMGTKSEYVSKVVSDELDTDAVERAETYYDNVIARIGSDYNAAEESIAIIQSSYATDAGGDEIAEAEIMTFSFPIKSLIDAPWNIDGNGASNYNSTLAELVALAVSEGSDVAIDDINATKEVQLYKAIYDTVLPDALKTILQPYIKN